MKSPITVWSFAVFSFIIFLTLITSCGEHPSLDETDVIVSNVFTDQPGDGGVMIYAVKKNATTVQETHARRLFAGSVMKLTSGFWDFFAVKYQGEPISSNGTNFTGSLVGDIRCASKSLELNGGLKTVYLDFSKNRCLGDFFGVSTFRNGTDGQFYRMKIEVCTVSEFALVTNYSSTCSTNVYYFRLILPDFSFDALQNSGKVISMGNGLFSQCFKHVDGSTLTWLPYKIPSGYDQLRSPAFMLYLYDTSDTTCSNLKSRVVFPSSYHSEPSAGQTKVFTNTANQTVKIFILKNF
jgi:hypothetical protein